MEPLQLIRQAAMSNAVITCVDGFYTFDGKQFDVNTKTAFKRTHQSIITDIMIDRSTLNPQKFNGAFCF